MHQPEHQSLPASTQQCIDNCTECHETCTRMLAYCLEMGGEHVEPAHLKSLLDCAGACAVSADFMLRGSDLHPHMCGVCADACERCAQSCAQFAGNKQMEACAEICRRCAESCREMAGIKT